MTTNVSFETAKLLKEKGFDELTTHWYQRGVDSFILKVSVEGKKDFYNRKGGVYTSAPTIAEVIMWLYDKHGIWIFADFGLGWGSFTIPCGYNGNATTKDLHYNANNFDSPTKAYEAAIDYTLKNLI